MGRWVTGTDPLLAMELSGHRQRYQVHQMWTDLYTVLKNTRQLQNAFVVKFLRCRLRPTAFIAERTATVSHNTLQLTSQHTSCAT